MIMSVASLGRLGFVRGRAGGVLGVACTWKRRRQSCFSRGPGRWTSTGTVSLSSARHAPAPRGCAHQTTIRTSISGRSDGALTREPRLLAMEREGQAGNDEGQEKDRQDALSAASEGDGFALGGVEGLGSAGVSAVADLQGVMSGFDRYLDRCRSIRVIRHAPRRARRRTCRDGPPLRWFCASASALLTRLIAILF